MFVPVDVSATLSLNDDPLTSAEKVVPIVPMAASLTATAAFVPSWVTKAIPLAMLVEPLLIEYSTRIAL